MFSFGATFSNALKSVNVPIWTRKPCQVQYPNVDDSMLCTGGVAGQGACSSDSGSPLILDDGEDNGVLVGLVSAGYGCGQARVPGLYTCVSSVVNCITAYTALVSIVYDGGDTEEPTVSPVPSAPAFLAPSPSTITANSGTQTNSPSRSNDKNNSSSDQRRRAVLVCDYPRGATPDDNRDHKGQSGGIVAGNKWRRWSARSFDEVGGSTGDLFERNHAVFGWRSERTTVGHRGA